MLVLFISIYRLLICYCLHVATLISPLHHFPQVCHLYPFFILSPVLTALLICVLSTVCLTFSHSQAISLIFQYLIDAFAYMAHVPYCYAFNDVYIKNIYYQLLLLRSPSLCLSPIPHQMDHICQIDQIATLLHEHMLACPYRLHPEGFYWDESKNA